MRALLVCSTALLAALLAVSPEVASAQMKLSPKATAPGGMETRYFTSIDGLMEGNADVILKETRQGKTVTAAVQEGIVPGGGVALLRAKKTVGRIHTDNADVQAGINIVLKALEAPIRQIAENAGVEGSIVVGRILEDKSETFGFDAQNEDYVDMVEKGIIDPAKVVRTALQDAASIAGLLVTTEAMVAEAPKEAAPASGGGGF